MKLWLVVLLKCRIKLESEYGTRVSVLACLEHSDTICMNIVNPMHNLFLGSTKHFLKIFKENGYLSSNLEKMQAAKTGSFVVPHYVGKIPRKLVSSFDGFNAGEYKDWLLLFFVYSMDRIILSKDMECLCKLVIKSTYPSKKFISKNDLVIAH